MKIIDFLIDSFESMPRKVKAFVLLCWVYIGITYIIKDIMWLVSKF
jgi:hypothetical protein